MTNRTQPWVCIVDDDSAIRESLRALFEEEGYTVEEVENGAAALALLRAAPRRRVVLLDQVMPGFDGLQTLHLLSAVPDLWRRTAIIFMTARTGLLELDLTQLSAGLAITTVIKPFDLDALLLAVENAQARLAERGAPSESASSHQ